MNFHICNLEYACGDNLKNVSAIHWDQNEDYPQFSGDNLVICDGYSRVLSKLAEGLDIEFETRVGHTVNTWQRLTLQSDMGCNTCNVIGIFMQQIGGWF